jgi:hypothetical protein
MTYTLAYADAAATFRNLPRTYGCAMETNDMVHPLVQRLDFVPGTEIITSASIPTPRRRSSHWAGTPRPNH